MYLVDLNTDLFKEKTHLLQKQRQNKKKMVYKNKNIATLSPYTGKNNGFLFLDISGHLKNTHKNPKFGKVRQVPTREFPTKFPDWDLSNSSKFGIFMGIL